MQESERLLQALTTCRGKSLYIVISDSWSIEKLERMAWSKLRCSAMCSPSCLLNSRGPENCRAWTWGGPRVQHLLSLCLPCGSSQLQCMLCFPLVLLHSAWLATAALPAKSRCDLLLISSGFLNLEKLDGLHHLGEKAQSVARSGCSDRWRAFPIPGPLSAPFEPEDQ